MSDSSSWNPSAVNNNFKPWRSSDLPYQWSLWWSSLLESFMSQPSGPRPFSSLLCGDQFLLHSGCASERFSLWNRIRLWDPGTRWWPWVFSCCLVLFHQGLMRSRLRWRLLVAMACSFAVVFLWWDLVQSCWYWLRWWAVSCSGFPVFGCPLQVFFFP